MAHYSSQLLYLEDEIKQSLKGISVKPLVFASCAQLGVNAGVVEHWATVMAYDHRPTVRWRPIYVLGLYVHKKNLSEMTDLVRDRIEPVCGESYVQRSLS